MYTNNWVEVNNMKALWSVTIKDILNKQYYVMNRSVYDAIKRIKI